MTTSTFRSGALSASVLISMRRKLAVLRARSEPGQASYIVIVWVTLPPSWPCSTELMSSGPRWSLGSWNVSVLARATPAPASATSATASTAQDLLRRRSLILPSVTVRNRIPVGDGGQPLPVGRSIPSPHELCLRLDRRARNRSLPEGPSGPRRHGLRGQRDGTAGPDRLVRALSRQAGRALLRSPGARRLRGGR